MDIDHAHCIAICTITVESRTFDNKEAHHRANLMDEETMPFERTAILFYQLMHPGEI
jgi:hypothetical protein